jgi:prepilin-type processing-associated H-X9-DG protein
MQCTNNLKQLGIALHNYHDTLSVFPAGRGGPREVGWTGTLNAANNDGNSRWSALIFIMPYMEQTALYDAYKNMVDSTDGAGFLTSGTKPSGTSVAPWIGAGLIANYAADPAKYQAGMNLFSGKVSYLACPSDPLSNTLQAPSGTSPFPGYAGTSYHTCRGDLFCSGIYLSTSTSFTASIAQLVDSRGIFVPGINYDMGSCTDGTSNTFAFSESGILDLNNRNAIRGGHYHDGWGASNTGIPSQSPQDCLNSRDPSNPKQHKGNTTGAVERGLQRFDGRHGCNGFHTILPPNSPTCGNGTTSPTILSANSYHSGGVNVLRCDGSVTFVSDTIEAGNPSISAHQGTTSSSYGTGNSAYGVWGAMGTRNGGESKSL